MALFLQYHSSPQVAVWDEDDHNLPGKLGSIYETPTYGGQLCKLVDAGAVAGDIVYRKKYDGSYEVTPTIGNSSLYEVAGVITTTVLVNQICFVQTKGLVAVKANGTFGDGIPVWVDTASNRAVPGGILSGSLTAATTTGGGDVLSVANPLSGAWIVTSLIINRTTKSTGAAALDFGVAANGTTSSDNLIDGLAAGATEANGENNFANAGTNGKPSVYGAAGTFLTGTTSATLAGLVATYTATFRPAGSAATPPMLGIAQAALSSGKVSTFLDLTYLPRQVNQ
jgi:hypothetical protein